jgi:hypothetical protein
MNTYPEYWPQFYTATINNWQHLLEDDKHKNIIVDSLKFLVTEKRIELNAFVISVSRRRLVSDQRHYCTSLLLAASLTML